MIWFYSGRRQLSFVENDIKLFGNRIAPVHSTLLEKSAKMPIQDFAHNWLLDFNGKYIRIFVHQRKHCSRTGIGLFAYVISASDLRVLHDLDELNKYADDSYSIVPSVNSHLLAEELEHNSVWERQNNLTLNVSKTK